MDKSEVHLSIQVDGLIRSVLIDIIKEFFHPPASLHPTFVVWYVLVTARQLLGRHTHTLMEEQLLQHWPVLFPTCSLEQLQ